MNNQHTTLEKFSVGEWEVNCEENRIFNGSETKNLRPKLVEFLFYLATHQGRVITKQELLEQIWPNTVVDDAIVKKSISQIRKELNDDPKSPRILLTIAKRGYQLIAPVKLSEPQKNNHLSSLSKIPYRGLKVFRTEHSKLFFGRDGAIQEILSHLQQPTNEIGPFSLIVGSSGAGKSSLVFAGLIPQLLKKTPDICWKTITLSHEFYKHQDPINSLFNQLCTQIIRINGEDTTQMKSIRENVPNITFETDDNYDYLASYIVDLLNNHSLPEDGSKPLNLFLFLDQLEGLLNCSIEGSTLEAFFAFISSLVSTQRCWVVSTLRSDYYPQCLEINSLLALKRDSGHYDLTAPTMAEISQIINKPAELAGLTFDIDNDGRKLDERLLEDALKVSTPLPLLEFALEQLYKERDENQLKSQAYQSMGGIAGCLSQKAESVFKELPKESQEAFPRIMYQLLNTENESATQVIQSPCHWQYFADDEHAIALINALVEARLLISEINGEQRPVIKLAHESLITHWQRLQNWIRENSKILFIKQEISRASNLWHSANFNNDHLTSRQRHIDEFTLIENSPLTLNKTEIQFILNSRKQYRRRKWFRLGVFISLATFTLISITMSLVAFNAQRKAETESNTASEVSRYLFKILLSADPVEGLGGETPIRTVLDKGSIDIAERLKTQPEVHFNVLMVIARVYLKLNEFEKAKQHYQQAIVLRNQQNPLIFDVNNNSLEGLILTSIASRDQNAVALAHSLLSDRTARLDSQSYHIGDAHLHIAQAYTTQIYPEVSDEKIENHLNIALNIYQSQLGVNHPKVADIYKEFSLLKEDITYRQKAQTILEKTQGSFSNQSLVNQTIMAILKKYQSPFIAQSELQFILSKLEKHHPQNIIAISDVLFYLADNYRFTGNQEKTLELLQKLQSLNSEKLNQYKKNTEMIRFLFAETALYQGNFQRFQSYLQLSDAPIEFDAQYLMFCYDYIQGDFHLAKTRKDILQSHMKSSDFRQITKLKTKRDVLNIYNKRPDYRQTLELMDLLIQIREEDVSEDFLLEKLTSIFNSDSLPYSLEALTSKKIVIDMTIKSCQKSNNIKELKRRLEELLL